MIHLVNWSATRKTPSHPEVHEDPVALTDIWVKLNIPIGKASVYAVVAGKKLEVQTVGNASKVMLPRIEIGEIVCFEI
jgi:hypothetical protein